MVGAVGAWALAQGCLQVACGSVGNGNQNRIYCAFIKHTSCFEYILFLLLHCGSRDLLHTQCHVWWWIQALGKPDTTKQQRLKSRLSGLQHNSAGLGLVVFLRACEEEISAGLTHSVQGALAKKPSISCGQHYVMAAVLLHHHLLHI